jgi:glycosyltransferase involved in cell wall biosynthesis
MWPDDKDPDLMRRSPGPTSASPRILHIAPFNTAGVPMAFVKAEQALGYESRLITFSPNRYGFEEDVCLNLPWMSGRAFQTIRDGLSSASRRSNKSLGTTASPDDIPLVWQPHVIEAILIALRERRWRPKIEDALKSLDFYSFDIYQFDGGMDFYRRGDIAKELHLRGKKIVCCYFGSDLRTRGVLSDLDAISEINFTVEFDHLQLHPEIHYVFFPFDPWQYKPVARNNPRLRLFHSATNRTYKGSDHIIQIGQRLEQEFEVEFVFMENTPHEQVLAAKQQCDLVIDQITNLGGIGYGISSLEALSMGIPVCTRLTPEYEAFIPDHPFISVTPDTLYDQLVTLIRSSELRQQYGRHGRQWVEQYHDARNVVKHMHTMYEERGWEG